MPQPMRYKDHKRRRDFRDSASTLLPLRMEATMITVAGIFADRASAADAVRDLIAMGIEGKNVDLLSPGDSDERVSEVPTADSEQPGMGRAVGSVVGGAVGIASGLSLGTMAAASFLVPGIGPVLGLGALGAAALGLAGGAAGGAVGEQMDRGLMDGLPKDEVFLYEDALRQGRSVVICLARDEAERKEVQRVLLREGVESIDAARQRWWTGLRAAEREHYIGDGSDFETEEDIFRRGFETSLHPEFRGRSWEQAVYVLAERDPDWSTECFRKGYERGQRYHRSLVERHLSAG
jgi:hypothetical protein